MQVFILATLISAAFAASGHLPVECAPDEWQCNNHRQCIKEYEYCDGKYDCRDKSDEFQCFSQYGDCDFDSQGDWMRECQWKSMNLDFEWSRARVGRSDETGPGRNKNPRQSGYFLYIDSSKALEGTSAGILTPVFKASEGKCHLRFWYNMHGSPSMGTLDVYTEGVDDEIMHLWEEQGPQGREWKYAHVPVGNSQDFRVSFVATVGGDNKTDIAIDEVRFTSGCEEAGEVVVPTGPSSLCLDNEFRCRNGYIKCIPIEWKCDSAPDCADGSDEDDCGEVVVHTGNFSLCLDNEFRCKSGSIKCIPKEWKCDSAPDCQDGSDEDDCGEVVVPTGNFSLCLDDEFRCKSGSIKCIPIEWKCDSAPDCQDGSDEDDCESPSDPMMNSGLFEGDIIGIDPDADRNAVFHDSQRWPEGVVPYVIDADREELLSLIRKSMAHIEYYSCVRFVERTNEHDYIKIFKGKGCYSYWGRTGGEQKLSLGPGCENFAVIMHELLHAIGFEHEHNRSDRDEYLIINWDNIVPEYQYAFRKLRPDQNRLLTQFDFSSIMLYGSYSFAKEHGTEKYSMVRKDGMFIPEIYDRESMSVLDSRRINMLYQCKREEDDE